MNSALRTSWRVWRAPRARTAGDRAFHLYLIALLSLVVIAPIVRGVWMLVSDPARAAQLAPTAASGNVMLVVATAWIAALLAGGFRGPVVFAPYLAATLSASPIPRQHAYARPFWRTAMVATSIGALLASVVTASWATQGVASGTGAATMVAMGAASGMIAAALWLFGQYASPRTTGVIVAMLAGSLIAVLLAPATAVFTPLGWVSLTYAQAGMSFWWVPLAACGVLAAALAPVMLARLHADSVMAQSLRWESARLHAGVFDLSASLATYQPLPHIQRRAFAIVLAGRLWQRVLVRDAVGAIRTPTRLLAGAAGMLLAGALLATSAAIGAGALAAISGVVTFVALGPFTDGIRHISEAAVAIPLYGATDLALIASHAILPLLTGFVLLTLGGIAVAAWLPVSIGGSAAASIVLALACVGARVMGAFKPPMPIALLMPVPTPMGDVAALARAAWAVDGVMLAGFAGVAASTVMGAPWMSVVTLAVGATVIVQRWRRR